MRAGVIAPFTANTPYVNTIPVEEQPLYPGDREIERRIKNLIRWNAAAMVVQANAHSGGIGGHISTYASLATLLEVGFHHFFRAHTREAAGDFVYFQGHASPGRLRARVPRGPALGRPARATSGASSRRAAGLALLSAPLADAGVLGIADGVDGAVGDLARSTRRASPATCRRAASPTPRTTPRLGVPRRRRDGRAREHGRDHPRRARAPRQPHLGRQLQPAAPRRPGARQRQDHPGARGGVPRRRLERHQGDLGRRLGPAAGARRRRPARRAAWARWSTASTRSTRSSPATTSASTSSAPIRELLALVEDLTDAKLRTPAARRPRSREGLRRLQGRRRAPRRADRDARQDHQGLRARRRRRGPQHLAPGEEARREGAARLPRSPRHPDRRRRRCDDVPFYRPPDDSDEIAVPARAARRPRRPGPATGRSARSRSRRCRPQLFAEFRDGDRARGRDDAGLRQHAAPPDERRDRSAAWSCRSSPTRRAPSAWTRSSASSASTRSRASATSRSTPTSSPTTARPRTGSCSRRASPRPARMASFTAAGTAYAAHGVNTIPFFLFYSMFGFQRIGDLIWQHADARGKGFLVGATAGRTTLAGRGPAAPGRPQPRPRERGADAARLRSGLRLRDRGDRRGRHPPHVRRARERLLLPDGDERGVRAAADARGRRGGHPARALQGAAGARSGGSARASTSSAAARSCARRCAAQELLAARGVAADVWSVTSYTELRREALAVERWNMLHPGEPPSASYLTRGARRRAVADRRRDRLHEDRRRTRSRPSCRPACTPSAPTASAAARRARRCAASSRSTRSRSASPPFRSLAARREIVAARVADAMRELGIDAAKPDPTRA